MIVEIRTRVDITNGKVRLLPYDNQNVDVMVAVGKAVTTAVCGNKFVDWPNKPDSKVRAQLAEVARSAIEILDSAPTNKQVHEEWEENQKCARKLKRS